MIGNLNEPPPEELRDDKQAILMAVSLKGEYLRHASERLKNDKQICLVAIDQNADSLQYVGCELKKDLEIVWGAVRIRGVEILEQVSKQLSEDGKFLNSILELNSSSYDKIEVEKILSYADENMRGNKTFILGAIRTLGSSYMKYVDRKLFETDIEFCVDILRVNPNSIEQMNDNLQRKIIRNKNIILDILKKTDTSQEEKGKRSNCGEILRYVRDTSIIIEALKIDGMYLEFVGKNLVDDEIVLHAVQQNRNSLKFANESSLTNLDLLYISIRTFEKPLEAEIFLNGILKDGWYDYVIPLVLYKITGFQGLWDAIQERNGDEIVKILESKMLGLNLLKLAGSEAGYVYKYLVPETRKDISIILETLKQMSCFNDAEKTKEFVFHECAVREYGILLEIYSYTQNEFILDVLKTEKQNTIEAKGKRLLFEKQLVLDLIDQSGRNSCHIYQWLPNSMKMDKQIVINSLSNAFETFEYIPELYKDTQLKDLRLCLIKSHWDTFITEIVERDPLFSMEELFLSDDNLIEEVLKRDAKYFRSVDTDVRSEEKFLVNSIVLNFECWLYFEKNFRTEEMLVKGLRKYSWMSGKKQIVKNDDMSRLDFLNSEAETVATGTDWRFTIILKNVNVEIRNCMKHLF